MTSRLRTEHSSALPDREECRGGCGDGRHYRRSSPCDRDGQPGASDNAMKQSEDAIRSRVLAAVERLEASGVVAGPPVMRAARRKKNVRDVILARPSRQRPRITFANAVNAMLEILSVQRVEEWVVAKDLLAHGWGLQDDADP